MTELASIKSPSTFADRIASSSPPRAARASLSIACSDFSRGSISFCTRTRASFGKTPNAIAASFEGSSSANRSSTSAPRRSQTAERSCSSFSAILCREWTGRPAGPGDGVPRSGRQACWPSRTATTGSQRRMQRPSRSRGEAARRPFQNLHLRRVRSGLCHDVLVRRRHPRHRPRRLTGREVQ